MNIGAKKQRWVLAATTALCLSAAGAGLVMAWGDMNDLILSDHPFLKGVQMKLDAYQNHYRPEKVYVHTDKTFYEPGENIWLAAYIRDAQTLKASPQSDIVYVELLNPQGAIMQSINLIGKDGKAAGDFALPATAKGGLYTIQAYTNWQKNAGTMFERKIQVQKTVLPNLNMRLEFDRKGYGANDEVVASLSLNSLDKQPLANHDFNYYYKLDGEVKGTAQLKTDENGITRVKFNLPKDLSTNDGLLEIILEYKGQRESISRSIPIVLGNIDLAFYPEGGQWLTGVECGMAFKAINEFGKPTDIAGDILDNKGKKVASFSSYHQGMGSLRFVPEAGQKYTAKITQPEGINKKYELPEAAAKGYTLNAEEQDKNRVVLGIYSHQDEELFLVGQARGKMYHSQTVKAKKGANSIYIDTKAFPIGIMQFTLFDSKQVAQAERLIFTNPHDQLDIKIKTDKEKYMPREKVNMTISVSDSKGNPVTGDFSIAVADDKLLTFADDKQGHLLSEMLLESDIEGEIEEPNFYFDNENDPARFKPEVSRSRALDQLLMTQGWRKFTWESVMAQQFPVQSSPSELAIVKGRVTDLAGKPLAKAKIVAGNALKSNAISDSMGNFALTGIELYEPVTVNISAANHQTINQTVSSYQQMMNVALAGMRWVSGKVTDEHGKPVADATVLVPGSSNETKTNKQGEFKVECGQNISYLEIHKDKYQMNYGYIYGQADVNNVQAQLYSEDYRRKILEQEAKWQNDNEVFFGAGVEDVVAVERLQAAPNMGRSGNIAKQNKGRTLGAEEIANMPTRNISALAATTAGISQESPDVFTTGNVTESGRIDIESAADESVAIGGEEVLFDKAKGDIANRKLPVQVQQQAVVRTYYRARQFAHVDYANSKVPEMRDDFRQTIYWNPMVRVENGTAQLSFYNSDDITQFRVTIEGFGKSGSIGRTEYKYFTQMPFEMVVKIPSEALMGDVLWIPLALTNNTDATLTGDLQTALPANMRWKLSPSAKISMNARESKTLFLQAEVLYEGDNKGNLEVHFRSAGLSDGISKPIRTSPRGFPVEQVFTGRNLAHKYQMNLNAPIPGSVRARVRLYPNTLDEVMQGISSMLRMPGGCFEQTTSGNYPNVLALSYLRETNSSNPQIENTAKGYLDHGYKILAGYESPGGGFDWWGRNPAHEALTAFGIMQFIDMKKIYPEVDEKMIQRAMDWLLTRRNGKGGWDKNPNAAHTWAVSEITDAYIVYALAEAGYAAKISKEIDKSYDDAVKSEDPYMMALMANALLEIKDSRAKTLLNELTKMQQKDGSFKGLNHSVVASMGKALDIETTALVALAMMKNESNLDMVSKAVDFIQTGKDYYGYGSTQGTVLGLKAILEYTKQSKRTAESGTLAVYIGGKKVASVSYQAGQKQIDEIDFGKMLTASEQVVELRYEGTKTAIPFDVELVYASRQPKTSEKCPFTLATKLQNNKAKMGETVRLTTTLTNTTNIDQPVTMAMVGIPAGLSLQPWQLKELQDKKVFDYYEIFKGFVVFHFERMDPKAVRTIHLDLKADIPGSYEAPASSAFLYYTYEHKTWDVPQQIEILTGI